ncbi:hypothetical protein [Streptomyces minutiscleroticus]|uniref:Secreted protein n=1 Tax=Streptomyces minutiscleroticus TaxID=68238 RepID=A0A918P1R4_9ACTN|nr:hypothetical protein [Streptomyces minutiscleroticus]GGY13791.1 hypothetical protein GCM10010358_77540 [Streptomyces minutiscleroticus]
MRKFITMAALLGLTALGAAVPTTAAQASESTVTGPGCESAWGPRNGYMYAWDHLDCHDPLLIAASGDSADWGSARNRAASVMNRGYVGGRDHVKFYEYIYYGGGHACLAPGELYADDLNNDRFTGDPNGDALVVDNIESHRWVTRSECGTLLT